MSAAQQYLQRSTRYVFQTGDQTLMRFADMDTRGVKHSAAIRNLSETGLAFTFSSETEYAAMPDEGEVLKIEFAIPGRKMIACFATVVRIEMKNEWDPEWGDRGYFIVGLQFRNLPTLHLRAIQLGLRGRVDREPEFDWSADRRRHTIAFSLAAVAMPFAMFVMATPMYAWIHWLM
jgi:hypothetical protein